MTRSLIGLYAVGTSISAACAGGLRRRSVALQGCDGAASFDHSDLDAVLREFVTKPTMRDGINSTLFDYGGALQSPTALKRLDDYAAKLAHSSTEKTLECLSREGRLAFWVNAYNGLVLRFVLGTAREESGCGGPSSAIRALPKSIQDLSCKSAKQVWDCEAGAVAGRKMTLEEVEGEARKLGDARIHAAVNCASLSCPNLRAGAYDPSVIDAQLDEQLTSWLEDETKGVARDSNGGLLVTPIFKWHSVDFGDASKFLAKHSKKYGDGPLIAGYLPYNWKLNSPPP
eukprot:CAMPEP_0197923336 /NCGR_PEP_ID=MMETSP1439-20131203/93790_1 /TAXON_ID=66791 /ORGANISM="Gonyaulax spinifera, Strain CCMP409" /LENGTH=285 /DNA_ID=CAMNT_0043545697 /DNA_START=73 /DNA_END=926 /DNA_ORIENTATION=+